MRPKSIAILMLALGCGLVASIGARQLLARRLAEGTVPTGETQTVFVAIGDVGLGDVLSPQMLKPEQWPKDKVPAGAITRLEDVEGRRIRTRLYANEPILENKLMGKGANEQGATSMIPKGYRVVPVRVDMTSGGSNLIQPGDRVDLMLYLTRDPGREIPETITRTILQDIKVFAVNEILDLEEGKDAARSIKAQTVSFLVTPDQAAKVMLAQQMGTIQLVMRSPDDDALAVNAQARPNELFGEPTKSKRSNEIQTPETRETKSPAKSGEGKGFVGFLDALQSKMHVPAAKAAKGPETWTMRIIAPDAVNDVQFESTQNVSDPKAAGHWKTMSTTVTQSSDKSVPTSPPADPQAGAAPKEPVAKEPTEPTQKEGQSAGDDSKQGISLNGDDVVIKIPRY